MSSASEGAPYDGHCLQSGMGVRPVSVASFNGLFPKQIC